MVDQDTERTYDHDIDTTHAGRGVPEYLRYASTGLYLIFGLLFISGMWADWKMRGQALIPSLAIADEPGANSGLFILGMGVLALGFIVGKAAQFAEEWQKEETDQTQEWTVDIRSE